MHQHGGFLLFWLLFLHQAELGQIGLQLHDAGLQLHIALGVRLGQHRAACVEVQDIHRIAHVQILGRRSHRRATLQPLAQAVQIVLHALAQGVYLGLAALRALLLHAF